MTCLKITESQNDQIYPEDTFSHGAAHLYIPFFHVVMRADAFIKYIFSTNKLTFYLYEKKKRNFNKMRKKASSQSTHIYLKNHSYLNDILCHLSVKCF